MFAGGFGDIDATEHACNLVDPLRCCQLNDLRTGLPVLHALCYLPVVIATRGDLRQMGAALTHGGRPVFEYTALQVKQAVVGNGHADKQQVMHMVKRLLNLAGEPSPDAADALACAICHAHGGMGLGALVTAGLRRKGGRLS